MKRLSEIPDTFEMLYRDGRRAFTGTSISVERSSVGILLNLFRYEKKYN